jgi:RNA polymerase sigma factor (sigma-70 family)
VFARRRLGAAAADDFCQETLLVFVRALRERRIERPESAGSFVLGICKNLARAGARAAERHPHVPGLDLLPDLREALREVDARISYWHVEDCLSRVTERARQVLRGRFEAEEPDARIAARLGLSEPNVRVLRHRTLAFLRECLEGA